ncbi:MAG: phage holin family protein [Oryzihumus sp.]
MTRLRVADVARLVAGWALSAVALGVTVALLPGVSADSWRPVVVAAAATGVVGAVVRPVLVTVAAAVGWLAVGLAAVVGQALVMNLALSVVPGMHWSSFWSLVAASWIAAAVGTALAWLSSAGTDEAFTASLRRRQRGVHVDDPEVDGVVFVQLDGVAHPVLSWALRSGSMPHLRHWVDSGSHRLHEWTVQLPCTTPASQQAILHGTAAGVPAFRWYDRTLGRLLVANRPADAAVIEARVSDGRGLLADGGVSVSNLFTGDAPRSSMTMSRLEAVSRGSRATRTAFARFLVRPDGLARSVARTVAEVARERFQAERQDRLDVVPRVQRTWTFAGLRAFSNGLLRDMNTAVVVDEMLRGTRSVYVDYVDYDEIAHHAGATRLESLAALAALDQVIGILEQVAAQAPRRYRLVVLSDHGQSQGEPFAARHGEDLAGLCARLARAPVTGVEEGVESWGRVGSLVDDLAGQGGGTQRLARGMARRVDAHVTPAPEQDGSELVVLGSGNLGLVYVPGAIRLRREDLDARWPGLVAGLTTHPGIGFVACLTAGGPVAFGADGCRDLMTGAVSGIDPLAPYGDRAPALLRDAVLMPEAPDVYVNSTVDPGTAEVAAFEDLVGSHGGLGGWQDRGFVLAPTELLAPTEPIVGGACLHAHLVALLERLGHRRSV